MIDAARKVHPEIRLVIRVDNETDAALLRVEEPGAVVLCEEEFAAGMTRHLLETIR